MANQLKSLLGSIADIARASAPGQAFSGALQAGQARRQAPVNNQFLGLLAGGGPDAGQFARDSGRGDLSLAFDERKRQAILPVAFKVQSALRSGSTPEQARAMVINSPGIRDRLFQSGFGSEEIDQFDFSLASVDTLIAEALGIEEAFGVEDTLADNRVAQQNAQRSSQGVTGQPVPARTADGRNVFLQQMSDGSIRVVDDFSPITAERLSFQERTAEPGFVQQTEAAKVVGKAEGETVAQDLPPSQRAIRDARAALGTRTSRSKLINDTIDRTIDQTNKSNTGFIGGRNPFAVDLAGSIETIRANIGFEELNRLRQLAADSGSTGSGLGQVTEKEIAFLQAVLGSLARSQTEAQLDSNLRRAKAEIAGSLARVEAAFNEFERQGREEAPRSRQTPQQADGPGLPDLSTLSDQDLDALERRLSGQ